MEYYLEYKDTMLESSVETDGTTVFESIRGSMETDIVSNRLWDLYEKYGCVPVTDDTIVFESIRASIGKFIRDKIDMQSIKNTWDQIAKKFSHQWVKKNIDASEKKVLQKSYDVLKKDRLSFSEYKKNFANIAKFCKLSTDNIIIENIVFGKDEQKKDMIMVRYSQGKQKILIPNGTSLVHVSPVPNIKELKPAFRSKTKGKYMYPTPRCFFTLQKDIKPTKAGLENKKNLPVYS